MNEKVSITTQELEEILGRPLDDYNSFSFEIAELYDVHELMHPKEACQRIVEQGIQHEIKNVYPVREGTYKSGEIWKGAYQTIYFYFGKSLEGRDIVFNLGGDTPYCGCIELVHAGHEGAYFIEKLFPLLRAS